MKHLELFSGIGGFRRAMDLLSKDKVMDFKSVGYSEINPRAIKTYEANYLIRDDEVSLGDITLASKRVDLPRFDLISGGFPCQTFSLMGNQAGFNEERGQMFFHILSILSIYRPRYVLLENVRNLRSHDKGRTFATIQRELNVLGYDVYHDIFNTSDFHLPQKRNRVFIFATTENLPLGFEYKFSAKNIAEHFARIASNTSLQRYTDVCDILATNVSQKYYLSEKIKPTLLADGSVNFRSQSDINQVIARPLTATMHKMHRACQDNYYSQDFIESRGTINPVLTKSKEELSKLQIRRITPEEAFLLQGFPAEFVTKSRAIGVSDGALYQQAGNAVSVNVVYAILHYLISDFVIVD